LLSPVSKDFIHTHGVPFHSAHGSYEPVFYDIFSSDLANYNVLVTGESGQGKSYLSCHVAYYSKLQYGDELTIGFYDLGGSLDKVALYLGGTRFDGKINPFLIKDELFIRDFIVSVVGEAEFSKKAKGELLLIIKEELTRASDFRHLISTISNKMSQVSDINYYFSEFWDFFTNEDIDLPSVFYIDFESIPKDLQIAYVKYVRELVKLKNTKVLNIYDEMWHYLKRFPEVMKEDAKTGRKKEEANWFFTQQINELSENDNDACDAIIGNSSLKIYFSQPSVKSKSVSSETKAVVGSIKSKRDHYSEFFLESKEINKVLRIYKEELIYELAVSEKSRREKQNKFLDKAVNLMGYREAFNLYVRSNYAL
jgi:hypothetical protein